MKPILNERVSDIVYHFTTLDALINIINTGDLKFSSYIVSAKEKNFQIPNHYFYLSLTRQASPNVGYANKMNTSTSGGDLSAFGVIPAKETLKKDGYTQGNFDANEDDILDKIKGYNPYVKKNFTNGRIYVNYDKNQTKTRNDIVKGSQTEDRIFSKEPLLENAYNYILRIDILPIKGDFKIRLTFDGQLLSQRYRGKSIDYINNLYNEYMATPPSTDNEGNNNVNEGKKINAATSDLPGFYNENQWVRLFNSLNDNPEWLSKIFLHKTESTMQLGFTSLNKIIKNVEDGRTFFKKLQNTLASFKTKQLKTGSINDERLLQILKIIFALTKFNGGFVNKINICKNICNTYFDNIFVQYQNNNGINEVNLKDLLINKIDESKKLFKQDKKSDKNIIGWWYKVVNSNNPKAELACIQKIVNNVSHNAFNPKLYKAIWNFIINHGFKNYTDINPYSMSTVIGDVISNILGKNTRKRRKSSTTKGKTSNTKVTSGSTKGKTNSTKTSSTKGTSGNANAKNGNKKGKK